MRFHGVDPMSVSTPRNDVSALYSKPRETAAYGERRFHALGIPEQFIVTIVHKERDGTTRISMRKTDRNETKHFFSQITD